MSSLTYECAERDGISYVRLSGVVDENFDARSLLAEVNSPRVILNLAELQGIADGGKRLFRRTLEHLAENANEVLLWDASPKVTEQFAETPALLSKAKIASYQVSYKCVSCNRDLFVRLDAATLNPDDVSGAPCGGCDGKLRIQQNPETLVDLRAHAAGGDIAHQMKNEIIHLERELAGSPFPEVQTASDLPDAFETTGVILAGLGKTRIEELAPVRAGDKTRLDPRPAAPEATLPRKSDPDPRLDGDTTHAAPWPGKAQTKQSPLRPRPSRRVNRPVIGSGGAPAAVRRKSRPFAGLFEDEQKRLTAVGIGAFLLGVLAMTPFCDSNSLPERPVLEYTLSLNEGEFDQAEAILDRTEYELPAVLVELYRQEISRARAEAADVYRRQALEAYRSRRYDEAESYAAEAIAIEDPGGEMLFLRAQSLRLSGKRNAASPHYQSFFEKYPQDDKADDAMYWRSDALARLGQYDEAKELLEGIMALDRSNMKRQATKLLLELP